ncbi:MAG TPA: hypothetical protein VNA18_03355 [Nitrososphaeraceae archaeon]|nr:hypothetical protein [Nitrososphaeraceae archaeon]
MDVSSGFGGINWSNGEIALTSDIPTCYGKLIAKMINPNTCSIVCQVPRLIDIYYHILIPHSTPNSNIILLPTISNRFSVFSSCSYAPLKLPSLNAAIAWSNEVRIDSNSLIVTDV